MKRICKLAGTLIASMLICALAGCSAGLDTATSAASSSVAAYFGNHEITEDEITAYTQEYRDTNDLGDSDDWAAYLTANSLTPQTWREQVIREKADRILIEEKAAELGITVDDSQVAERIAQAKEAAGVDLNDDQSWADYLSAQGQTVEGFEDSCRFSSLEQQVYTAEIDFSSDVENEMCNDYIRMNLADRIVSRYSAILFDENDEQGARACIDELSQYEGEQLSARFAQIASERSLDRESAEDGGDIGWDFLYDEAAIDPDLTIMRANLTPGQLLDEPVKGDGGYRVVMCTERVSFVKIDFESLESESLKEIIRGMTLSSGWTALCLDYMDQLEEQANVQVSVMPDNLPYDVS